MNSIIPEPLFNLDMRIAGMPSFYSNFTSGFVGNFFIIDSSHLLTIPMSIGTIHSSHATLRYISFQPKLSLGEKAGLEPATW